MPQLRHESDQGRKSRDNRGATKGKDGIVWYRRLFMSPMRQSVLGSKLARHRNQMPEMRRESNQGYSTGAGDRVAKAKSKFASDASTVPS